MSKTKKLIKDILKQQESGTPWNDPNCDPMGDIEAVVNGMLEDIGIKPFVVSRMLLEFCITTDTTRMQLAGCSEEEIQKHTTWLKDVYQELLDKGIIVDYGGITYEPQQKEDSDKGFSR